MIVEDLLFVACQTVQQVCLGGFLWGGLGCPGNATIVPVVAHAAPEAAG